MDLLNKKTASKFLFQIMLAGFGLLSSCCLAAESRQLMPELDKPMVMVSGAGRLYIAEADSRIHIFTWNRTGWVHQKTFGRKGQGPGDLGTIHHLRVLPDCLEIPTRQRYTRFAHDGRFLDEIRINIPVIKDNIFRMGNVYLVRQYEVVGQSTEITSHLYSVDFKPIAEIGRIILSKGDGTINVIPDVHLARVYRNNAYICISTSHKTSVSIFDEQARVRKVLTLPLPSLKVTPQMHGASWILTGTTPWSGPPELPCGNGCPYPIILRGWTALRCRMSG